MGQGAITSRCGDSGSLGEILSGLGQVWLALRHLGSLWGWSPVRVIRVTLTARRSLPIFPRLADILRVIRHVSKVPVPEIRFELH
jgi:hypothetical protein